MDKSKLDAIKELYKALDPRDKVLFCNFYNRIREQEKQEMLQAKLKAVKELTEITNDAGQPYFSSDWIIKNVLKEN